MAFFHHVVSRDGEAHLCLMQAEGLHEVNILKLPSQICQCTEQLNGVGQGNAGEVNSQKLVVSLTVRRRMEYRVNVVEHVPPGRVFGKGRPARR